MAAPNIVNVATILGKTAVQAMGLSATAIVANAASSGTVVKVNALYIANKDASASYKATVEVYRPSLSPAATSYYIAYQVSIPAGSVLDVISKSIYLEEGDSIRLTAEAATKLDAICSYEVIS
jgi:hypothetical protein